MEFVAVLLVAAVVFGICYLVDKGFTKLFRSQSQHYSGTAVRLNKKYGSIGLILFVFGVGAIFAGLPSNLLFIIGGSLVSLMGCGLVVYYMSFGVFYDGDSFVLTTFGKHSTTYHYRDIQGQQLYMTAAGVVIEIFMEDGRTFQLQSTMKGVYEFMDKAFAGWLEQTGKTREECEFYDPDNSCWFPKVGE